MTKRWSFSTFELLAIGGMYLAIGAVASAIRFSVSAPETSTKELSEALTHAQARYSAQDECIRSQLGDDVARQIFRCTLPAKLGGQQ